MKLLLIDVAKDHFKWAIKQDGQVTLRGLAYTFEELHAIETHHQGEEVWIDEGFRTHEVRTAARLWKWNPVKGPSLMHDEIEAAFRTTLSGPSNRPEPAASAAGNPPSGASVGVAPEGVPNLSDTPYWHPLWKHMHHEHGLILLDDDCHQIARAVDESRGSLATCSPSLARWFCDGRTGSSSLAMACIHLGGNPKRGPVPADPSDLNRCLLLLEAAPEIRESFPAIAAHSKQWEALIARWDDVEALFLEECGRNWSKSAVGKRTYRLMREISDGANETSAATSSERNENE